jgi:hypothetical protein
MKPEKQTFLHKGKERSCTIEQGRNFIATDVETQFSGNGKTAEEAVAAMIRNLDIPAKYKN